MLFIRSLSDLSRSDFNLAGGKAVNLGELFRAGLPVPRGFVITTAAYTAFVNEHHLDKRIQEILQQTDGQDAATLDSTAQTIRQAFQQALISQPLQEEILAGYTEIFSEISPVAVRSSATAEDLPDMSFAGQQDTYLNVLGEEALLQAVVNCWASLWTGRAMAYRARNRMDTTQIALAVLVQEMVQSEVSGVLFTANPLSGGRMETVIDATFGLGEALVSGQVEPDHYVVQTVDDRILSRQLGSKALQIRGLVQGGTQTITEAKEHTQALGDSQIVELAQLGRQAADYFGAPQDVEWAWANGQFYLLQSRPITTLYPVPEGAKTDPLEAYLSFGVWQGMLDPYTPLGRAMFAYLVAGISRLFGVRVDPYRQRVMCPAGERLFVNISAMLRDEQGRKVIGLFIDAIDPVAGKIVHQLLKDSRFSLVQHGKIGGKLNTLLGALPLAANMGINMAFPNYGRRRFYRLTEHWFTGIQQACSQTADPGMLMQTIESMVIKSTPRLFPVLVAAIAAGQGMPYQVLIRMGSNLPDNEKLFLDLGRGLPYNVTIEMDMALWQIASHIRQEPQLTAYFTGYEAAELAVIFGQKLLPAPIQQELEQFLAAFGMRGVGEIDLGRPRWQDDPTPVFQNLQRYLQVEPSRSPDVVYRSGELVSAQAVERLLEEFAKTRGGYFKVQFAKFLIKRFRALGGLRESPKFTIIRMFGIYRKSFLKIGEQYTAAGLFSAPDDIFFLHPQEIKALTAGTLANAGTLITQRREIYQRELQRRRIPRILLADGTAYYDSVETDLSEDESNLLGSPVSAGIVEGLVRVVLDPHDAQLQPGEILVCPATDPAWTPLFLTAGGLVMEVGGMMTHGSVVAREYGLPAVVGVRQATQRLKTGQRIRVDGALGKITLLDV